MSDAARPSLAVVVLTLNEAANLPDCLDSLRGLDGRVVVVDSGSTDRTVEIAAARGAQVLRHPFESHSRQWRWAIANLDGRPDWILGLDADQRLSNELRDALAQLFAGDRRQLEGVDGFYICRRQIFRGRWIRHGGYYPKYLLKLFRPERVLLDEHDLVDHHFYVPGAVNTLTGDLIEDNRKEDEITFWVDKHVRYARLQAREELARGNGQSSGVLRPSLFGTADQKTLWQKRRWATLPLYWRSCAYFAYRYIIRLGFLDGKEGFAFHVLQAFWYRLLVDICLDDLRRGANLDGNARRQ